jgi:NADH dehydrogenase
LKFCRTPLLTRDQLRLLKYDNVSIWINIKLIQILGFPSVRFFDQEVKKYCYMWREGGQFSTEKYLANKDLEKNIINLFLG